MTNICRATPVLLAAVALACPVALAAPTTYELDPVHTRVMFSIDHARLSRSIGTVSGTTGTLRFDPADWSAARIEAQVPLTRLDLGDSKWNKAASAHSLLDVGNHPSATFVSSRTQGIDARHALVFGTMTLHGVAREVEFEVTFNVLRNHPMPPFRRSLGFSATTTISRKAFDVDGFPSVIGDDVELRIEGEAVRSSGGQDERQTP